jgi:hypothetical protein
MERTPVKSSNIVSVGYSPADKRMEIEFRGGGVYHHAEVPQSVYDAFMAAESKGSHYHAAIKGKFKHTKLDPA